MLCCCIGAAAGVTPASPPSLCEPGPPFSTPPPPCRAHWARCHGMSLPRTSLLARVPAFVESRLPPASVAFVTRGCSVPAAARAYTCRERGMDVRRPPPRVNHAVKRCAGAGARGTDRRAWPRRDYLTNSPCIQPQPAGKMLARCSRSVAGVTGRPSPSISRISRSHGSHITRNSACSSACPAAEPEASTSASCDASAASPGGQHANPRAASVLAARIHSCARGVGQWLHQARIQQLVFGCAARRTAAAGLSARRSQLRAAARAHAAHAHASDAAPRHGRPRSIPYPPRTAHDPAPQRPSRAVRRHAAAAAGNGGGCRAASAAGWRRERPVHQPRVPGRLLGVVHGADAQGAHRGRPAAAACVSSARRGGRSLRTRTRPHALGPPPPPLPPTDLHQAAEEGRVGPARDRGLGRDAFLPLGAVCGECTHPGQAGGAGTLPGPRPRRRTACHARGPLRCPI